MAFPDSPCDACPRVPKALPGPCLAMEVGNPRYCMHAGNGHEGYVALLCGERPPPPPMPSLARRVRNLAGAAILAVRSRARRVSKKERERRLSICRGCEHFDAAAARCRRCGCHLPLKTRLEAWHCPLDPPKW